MKLVARKPRPDREKGVLSFHVHDNVTVALGPLFHFESDGQKADHGILMPLHGQRFPQEHEPPALGIDRQAFFSRLP